MDSWLTDQQVELRKRLEEAEKHNDEMAARLEYTKRLVQRTRLERAILLERLEALTNEVAQPDQMESPPASPMALGAEAQAALVSAEKSTERKEEVRRRSQPRDPRLPRRPQNAYILFNESERDRVRRELESKYPGENHDLTRAVSDAWKALGPAGRKGYHDMYREDRLRYLKEMSVFPSAGLSATDQKEKQRAVKQLREWEAKEQANPEEGEAEGEIDMEDDPAEATRSGEGETGGEGEPGAEGDADRDVEMEAEIENEGSDASGDEVTEDEKLVIRIKPETFRPEPTSELASEPLSGYPSDSASEPPSELTSRPGTEDLGNTDLASDSPA